MHHGVAAHRTQGLVNRREPRDGNGTRGVKNCGSQSQLLSLHGTEQTVLQFL